MTWPDWRDPVADPPALDSSDFPATSHWKLVKTKHGRQYVAELQDWVIDPADRDPGEVPKWIMAGRDAYDIDDVTGWQDLPPL